MRYKYISLKQVYQPSDKAQRSDHFINIFVNACVLCTCRVWVSRLNTNENCLAKMIGHFVNLYVSHFEDSFHLVKNSISIESQNKCSISYGIYVVPSSKNGATQLAIAATT